MKKKKTSDQNPRAKEEIFSFLEKQLKDFLLNGWKEFNVGNKLIPQFNYENEELRKEMQEAIAFWRFLRKFPEISFLNHFDEKVAINIKREWTREMFIENGWEKENNPKNKYFRIIAQIETLPTIVWRKLLWRENIDFMSFESCLRRLTEEQKKAIEENFYDLFPRSSSFSHESKIPRVMKKTWRDRIKIFFGLIKLEEENYNDEKRNLSKGSWAFNLLGIDFGFSLYPKGENNDEKITNKKFTRFLSVKDHIDDFVVNTEDGKYFRAYKIARSNYVLRPKKNVDLKSHVCPGFWYTLIIHFIFWIVSPIAIISSLVLIVNNGFVWENMVPAIPGILMILWLAMATIKILFQFFIKKPLILLFKLLAKMNVKEETIKKTKKVFLIIGVIILASLLLFAVFKIIVLLALLYWKIASSMFSDLGIIIALLATITLYFYSTYCVIWFIRKIYEEETKYKKIPRSIRWTLHATIFSFIVSLFDNYLIKPIINTVISWSQSFWQWYTQDILISSWVILTIVFLVTLINFFMKFLKDDKWLSKIKNIFKLVNNSWLVITLLLFTYKIILMIGSDIYFIDFIGVLPLILFSFILISMGLSFTMLEEIRPEKIALKERAEEILSHSKTILDEDSDFKRIRNYIIYSKWIKKIEEEKRKEVVREIITLSNSLFYYLTNKEHFLYLIIIGGSEKIINEIDNNLFEIHPNYTEKEKIKIIESMTKGKSLKKAFSIIERDRKKKIIKRNRLKSFLKKLSWPFKKTAIGISRFFLTLKDLWDFFNKRCPTITKSRYLN